MPDTLTPLSVVVHPRDWGISDPAAIRWARLALVADSTGTHLEVHALSTALPASASPEAVPRRPALTRGAVVVLGPEPALRNRLGGVFSAFSRAPSSAAVQLVRGPDGRRSLRLGWERGPEGWAGMWMHLYPTGSDGGERPYLDVRRLSALGFWIRGAAGGEELLLRVADAEWDRREDALPLGRVGAFLPEGRVTTEWQRAVVPMSRLPRRLDRSLLATLVLEAAESGAGQVDLAGVAFSDDPDSLPGLPEPVSSAPGPVSARALWIWRTDSILASPRERESVEALIRAETIEEVFLQVPARLDERLAGLLAAWRAEGLRVHALDGAPGWVLPDGRAEAIRRVEEVVAFNRVQPEESRFDGLRHDVEPHLLPGFIGPRREAYVQGLLELLSRSGEQVREAGMTYGADIPFWYDAPDPLTGRVPVVPFGGAEKPVHEHVIDQVDDVGLMDYRTEAWGPDGTVAHAETELAYASRTGKRLFIGLETGWLPDREIVEVRGAPARTARASGEGRGWVFAHPEGDSLRIIFLPYEQRRPWLIPHPSAAVVWPVASRVPAPSRKVTFHDLGGERLREVMGDTAEGVAHEPSFAGFAIHYAASFRRLLRRR